MGHGPHGRRRRRGLLGAEFAPVTQEAPRSSVREYLNAQQLAEATPWSMSAIEKMVSRRILKRDVHYFQPFGRRTQLVFKWSGIVALIEDNQIKSDGTYSEHVVERRARIDVEQLIAVTHADIPGVLGQLEAVRAQLWSRLRTPEPEAVSKDETLTADAAAIMIGVSKDWLYRHTKLPFRIEVGPKQTRYSRRGIERWLAARTGPR
jgi:predicted DNA-binding transcriptional regulator AlpA